MTYPFKAEAVRLKAQKQRRQQERRARAQKRAAPLSSTQELMADMEEEKARGIDVEHQPIDAFVQSES